MLLYIKALHAQWLVPMHNATTNLNLFYYTKSNRIKSASPRPAPHPCGPQPQRRHASSRGHLIAIGRSSEPVADRDVRSDGPARPPVAAVLVARGAHGWAPALGPIPQNGSPPRVVSFVSSLPARSLRTTNSHLHRSRILTASFIMSSNFEAAHVCCRRGEEES
jgi:hypothetical protein